MAQKKTLKFADHALVFMARGIHKKWKQQISFDFNEGGFSSSALISIIKESICA